MNRLRGQIDNATFFKWLTEIDFDQMQIDCCIVYHSKNGELVTTDIFDKDKIKPLIDSGYMTNRIKELNSDELIFASNDKFITSFYVDLLRNVALETNIDLNVGFFYDNKTARADKFFEIKNDLKIVNGYVVGVTDNSKNVYVIPNKVKGVEKNAFQECINNPVITKEKVRDELELER